MSAAPAAPAVPPPPPVRHVRDMDAAELAAFEVANKLRPTGSRMAKLALLSDEEFRALGRALGVHR